MRPAVSSQIGLDDAASTLSRHSNTNTLNTGSHARSTLIDVREYRPAKRRRVAGLNTRFDRMIKSVDASLSYRTSSPTPSRKRIQSSGTSSVSSHDAPKTPVDAYSDLHPGKLGKDFSVLKMNKALLFPQNDSDGFPKPVAPPKEPRSPLPDWLANTFCTLETDHPLRGLLSPSRTKTESKPRPPSGELLAASGKEEIFAFSPFEQQDESQQTTCGADRTSNGQGHISSVGLIEPIQLHVELDTSTYPLPFSTPGRFAPVLRPIHSSIADRACRKPADPAPPQVTWPTNDVMHSTTESHLRPGNVTGTPQLIQAFSNLVQDTKLPSDLQDHGANMNHHHVFQGGYDNLNVYVTPGPTFTCSRPVYFDSPTEDPSLSDPLQPEFYELDLNAIDFRWRPFLRSNATDGDMDGRLVTPFSPPGHGVVNRVTVGDQSGWGSHFSVDTRACGRSSEDLPSLSEDVDIAHLDNAGPVLPNDIHTITTRSSTVRNTIGQWSSRINDVQEMRQVSAHPGVSLSPLRDQSEPTALAGTGILPRGDRRHIEPMLCEETNAIGPEVNTTRPLTPIRQVPVSPPSTPQKLRSSHLCEAPRAPVRKTSSALSWMIPFKPSKHAIAVRDDHLSCVSTGSHDSIESWSQTS